VAAVKELPEDRYHVSYKFEVAGREEESNVVVDAAGAERLLAGQVLALLYDPHNPADSDFFFAAVESCLIVPDFEGRG
jgi:hypothetical protein